MVRRQDERTSHWVSSTKRPSIHGAGIHGRIRSIRAHAGTRSGGLNAPGAEPARTGEEVQPGGVSDHTGQRRATRCSICCGPTHIHLLGGTPPSRSTATSCSPARRRGGVRASRQKEPSRAPHLDGREASEPIVTSSGIRPGFGQPSALVFGCAADHKGSRRVVEALAKTGRHRSHQLLMISPARMRLEVVRGRVLGNPVRRPRARAQTSHAEQGGLFRRKRQRPSAAIPSRWGTRRFQEPQGRRPRRCCSGWLDLRPHKKA